MSDNDQARKEAAKDHAVSQNTEHLRPHEGPNHDWRQAYNNKLDELNRKSNGG